MGRYKFPKTYAAIKSEEKAGWAIGDALLIEIGPPQKSGRTMRGIVATQDLLGECRTELAARGVNYSCAQLRSARDAAFHFPSPKDRKTSIWVAYTAGSPKVLSELARLAKSQDRKLSGVFVQHHAPSIRDALGERKGGRGRTRTLGGRLMGSAISSARSFARTAAKIDISELTDLERADINRRLEEMLSEWQAVLGTLQTVKRRRKAA